MNVCGSNKTHKIPPKGTHERNEKVFHAGNSSLSLFPSSIRKPALA
jgi:hypothetical protein